MTGGVQSRLATCLCFQCGSECAPEAMHPERFELCQACGTDVDAELAVERALDFRNLSREALITRVVGSAQAKALAMYPTTYSVKASA